MPVQVLWRWCFGFFVFFWCLCRFCDSNLHKTCTGIKQTKKTKPLDAQNLHRHQKKQSLSIYSGLGVYRLQNFGYFGFFDACAGFVKIMLWFFFFFDACAGFVTLTFTKPAQASKKKQKKQTTRCTKPAQASTKETKVWASTQGWGSIDCKILVILFFLMPVQVLWRSCFGFFSFFDACACFVKKSAGIKK